MKRCEEKIRYGTAAGATWSLWGIWLDRYLRGRRHRRERRAYACPHCEGWHLTSQSKRRRRTTRRTDAASPASTITGSRDGRAEF
jgi:hypothetical protein